MTSGKTMGDDTRQEMLDGGVKSIELQFILNGGEPVTLVSTDIVEAKFVMAKLETTDTESQAIFALIAMAEKPLMNRLRDLSLSTKGE